MSTAVLVSLVALGGVVLAQVVMMVQGGQARRNARREELLRNIRWAAELAGDDNDRKRQAGIAALKVLKDGSGADREVKDLVTALTRVTVGEQVETYTEGTSYLEAVNDDDGSDPSTGGTGTR